MHKAHGIDIYRSAWKTGAGALVLGIRVYQYCVSPLMPPCCRFSPTCSEYAAVAIQRFGLIKGLWLSVRRLLKCQPFHPGGADPVPGDHL